jgi:hypothetical protein
MIDLRAGCTEDAPPWPFKAECVAAESSLAPVADREAFGVMRGSVPLPLPPWRGTSRVGEPGSGIRRRGEPAPGSSGTLVSEALDKFAVFFSIVVSARVFFFTTFFTFFFVSVENGGPDVARKDTQYCRIGRNLLYWYI